MKFRAHIVVMQGPKLITRIEGIRALEGEALDLTIGNILELEEKLEKITGLRYHINLEQEQPSLSQMDLALDEERRNR